MTIERLHVFVDESGDEHLNITSGASKNYVLAAVLIRDEVLQAVVEAADSVRRRYFQTGKMKSSGVAGNTLRRERILGALSGLDFHVIAFCFAKARFKEESGLRFADTALKYTAKMLCRQLPKHQSVRVIFDAKGRSKFRGGFKSYLERSFPPMDLFRKMEFDSADSRSLVPIQMADIYAGSIARRCESEGEEFLPLNKLLRSKATVWEWPRNYDWGQVADRSGSGEFDAIVRREAFSRAWSFIESSGNQDDDFSLKVSFLKLLVDHETFDQGEFMHSDQISSRLKSELGEEIDRQALRNRLVGPLRDAGLLLASSPKGYRIPASVNDIQRYIDLSNSQIPPALSRIERTREVVRIATAGRLDILDGPELKNLKAAVESLG